MLHANSAREALVKVCTLPLLLAGRECVRGFSAGGLPSGLDLMTS